MPLTLLETGKDNLDFNTKKSAEKIKGISVVLYEDLISYGYWNFSDVLVKANVTSSLISNSEINKLAKAYKDIEFKISSASLPFLHIPKKYFKPRKVKAFFKEVYPADQLTGREACSEEIQDGNIVTAHFAPAILGKRNAQKLVHLSSCLNDYVGGETKLLATFSENTMHLIYKRDGELVFYNQFACKHPNDFLYFILLSYQELELSTKEVPLHLSGRITSRSSIATLLKQYVNIQWEKIGAEWIRPGEFPKQFYQDLYLTWKCG